MKITKQSHPAVVALAQLRDQGFDLSERYARTWRVRCSQCEALVINGIATHETGCPNGRSYTCPECGSRYRDADNASECCNGLEL